MDNLYQSYLEAKVQGLTQEQHAEKLGMKLTTYRSRLYKDRSALRLPESRYRKFDEPLVLEGDALVLMDMHIPFHHADFINKCLDVAQAWGVRQAFLGGDVLDLHAFSHFPDDFEEAERQVLSRDLLTELTRLAESMPAKHREKLYDMLAQAEPVTGNIGEEIKEARQVLRKFADQFDRIAWIMGNHEKRVLRLLQKALPAAMLTELFGATDPKWIVSPYYWGKLISAGKEWQIEHPNTIAKGASKRLASKFQTNIIMGHNHQFVIQADPSGKYLAVEPGMACDEQRMEYATVRHSTRDAHLPGAVMVYRGVPYMLNDAMTDWDAMTSRQFYT